MRKLKDIQATAKSWIQKEVDNGNAAMQQGVHDIDDMNWHMENKAWWITEQVSSDGYDSIKDAVDLMGTRNPKLTMTPYGDGEENQKQAEAIEQVLMWELGRTLNRRGAANKQATRQAFKYNRVCAQLIYLPWQIEALKALGKETKSQKMAMTTGNFILNIFDSRNVFPYWTDYGLEGVLSVTKMPAQEALDFWGDNNTGKLKQHLDKDEKLQWVTQFDYWDLDQRTVWIVPHVNSSYVAKADEEGYEVLSLALDIPFLPWIVSDLGESLEPLLYSVWKSGQWDLMNVYLSASSSEVTAYIAYPRYKITGPNPDSVRIVMGEPGRPVEVPPGHDIEVLPPPGMDDTLTQKIMSLQGMLSKSTISHSVANADFGQGAAYASIREMIDLTSRRLNDGKSILETFYRDVFTKMLRWIDFKEASITAYIDGEYGDAQQITITGNAELPGVMFNADNLDFKVELTADIPEDQVARNNAATMFTQLGGSKSKALEMVGISNPTKEIERARKEMLEDADIEGQASLIVGQYQLQLEQASMQMQMGMQEAQMAQMQQQQGQGNPSQQSAATATQRGGNQGNPAMGGMPPDMAAPGASSPPMSEYPPEIMGGR